jgi:hypothetical protein
VCSVSSQDRTRPSVNPIACSFRQGDWNTGHTICWRS